MHSKTIVLLILLLTSISCHGHGHDHHHHHDHNHDHEHDSHQHETQYFESETGIKYEMKSHVLILNHQNIKTAIIQFETILIKFYAPWCGHCKHLAPVYTQIATELAGRPANKFIIAQIDCSDSQNRQSCNSYGIKGYPTIKYFIDGQEYKYEGKRQKDEIINWLSSKLVQVRNEKKSTQL